MNPRSGGQRRRSAHWEPKHQYWRAGKSTEVFERILAMAKDSETSLRSFVDSSAEGNCTESVLEISLNELAEASNSFATLLLVV